MSIHDDLGRQDGVEGLLVGDLKGVVMLAVEQMYGFAKKEVTETQMAGLDGQPLVRSSSNLAHESNHVTLT